MKCFRPNVASPSRPKALEDTILGEVEDPPDLSLNPEMHVRGGQPGSPTDTRPQEDRLGFGQGCRGLHGEIEHVKPSPVVEAATPEPRSDRVEQSWGSPGSQAGEDVLQLNESVKGAADLHQGRFGQHPAELWRGSHQVG